MDLGGVVSVNFWPGHACDIVLSLADSVSDPIVSGVDDFGSSECDCFVCDSLRGDVVGDGCLYPSTLRTVRGENAA